MNYRVDALNSALGARVELPSALTGGGDSFDHYHSSDRNPTHDTLSRLQELSKRTPVTGAYSVTERDDIILCSAAATVTLPLARNGREFEIIMTGTAPVTVNLTSPDEVYGETSVLLEQQGTALRFKAVTGGWVFI